MAMPLTPAAHFADGAPFRPYTMAAEGLSARQRKSAPSRADIRDAKRAFRARQDRLADSIKRLFATILLRAPLLMRKQPPRTPSCFL